MHTSHYKTAQGAQILFGEIDERPKYDRRGKGIYTDSQIKKYIKSSAVTVAQGIFKRLILTLHLLIKAKPRAGHYRSGTWVVLNGKRCVYVL